MQGFDNSYKLLDISGIYGNNIANIRSFHNNFDFFLLNMNVDKWKKSINIFDGNFQNLFMYFDCNFSVNWRFFNKINEGIEDFWFITLYTSHLFKWFPRNSNEFTALQRELGLNFLHKATFEFIELKQKQLERTIRCNLLHYSLEHHL